MVTLMLYYIIYQEHLLLFKCNLYHICKNYTKNIHILNSNNIFKINLFKGIVCYKILVIQYIIILNYSTLNKYFIKQIKYHSNSNNNNSNFKYHPRRNNLKSLIAQKCFIHNMIFTIECQNNNNHVWYNIILKQKLKIFLQNLGF